MKRAIEILEDYVRSNNELIKYYDKYGDKSQAIIYRSENAELRKAVKVLNDCSAPQDNSL